MQKVTYLDDSHIAPPREHVSHVVIGDANDTQTIYNTFALCDAVGFDFSFGRPTLLQSHRNRKITQQWSVVVHRRS